MLATRVRIPWPLVLCALLLGPTPALADTVAYWPLDETSAGDLLDVAGGLDLSSGAGVGFGQAPLADPVGNPDAAAGSQNTGAIDFSSSTAAYHRASQALAITAAASLTFEGWLQIEAEPPAFAGGAVPQGVPGSGLVARLAGTHSLAAATGWMVSFHDSQRLGFMLTGHPSTPTYQYLPTTSVPIVADGTPHHFALVWDHDGGSTSGGMLTLYVDGVSQASFDDVEAPATNDVFVLGSSFAPGLEVLPGVLDEIRVSDAALTPTEFLNAFIPDQTQLQIVSNLDSPNLGHTGSTTDWTASEFRTDAQPWLLRAIEVDLNNFNPGFPLQANVHLFADAGNLPSSLIASFDPLDALDVPLEHIEYTGPPLLLDPNTSYWVAMEPSQTLWSGAHASPVGLTGPGTMTQPNTVVATSEAGPWSVHVSERRMRVRVLGTPIPPIPDGTFVDWSQQLSWDPANFTEIDAPHLEQGMVVRNVANTGLDMLLEAEVNAIPSPERDGANIRLSDNPGAADPAITLTFLNGSADVILTEITNLQNWETQTISNSDGLPMAIRQLVNADGELMRVNGVGVPVEGLPVAVGASANVSEVETTAGSTFLVEIPGARGFRWAVHSEFPFFGATTSRFELRLANVQIDPDPIPVLPPFGLAVLGLGAIAAAARGFRHRVRSAVD